MKKVCIITNKLDLEGISNIVLNYSIRLSKIYQITIFCGEPINENYEKICKQNNIIIEKLPPRKPKKLYFYKELYKRINPNCYDIMHVHGNSSAMIIEMLIGIIKKIKIRISHCHSTSSSNVSMHKFLKPLFNLTYTRAIACSKQAGIWLYGRKKFIVLENGIDLNKFLFDEDVRKTTREQLSINDKFVIGHIGRFNDAKNHEFIISLAEKFQKEKNIVFMLIGDGPKFNQIKESVKKMKLNNVIFLGSRHNVEKFYNAMDLFVFPSKYEGFGITMIEAQVNGLPCIASTNVPIETKVNDNVFYYDTESELENWLSKIEGYYKKKSSINRNVKIKQFDKFGIDNSAKKLCYIYDDI